VCDLLYRLYREREEEGKGGGRMREGETEE
jgi:hypothetical protein